MYKCKRTNIYYETIPGQTHTTTDKSVFNILHSLSIHFSNNKNTNFLRM